jgi:ssDNA-binding Zn-finger/Zn-ribbon topoisomerase 1
MIGTKVIIVVAVLVTVIAFIVEHQRKTGRPNVSFQRKDTLFSAAERSFLGVLEQSVGEHGRVFGMVRVADVLEPKRGMNGKERISALNRITSKHFDFVVCNPKTMAIVCAIELNDQSHSRKDRSDRDEFLVSACESAGLPLIQIPCRNSYSVSEIQESVLPHISSVSPDASGQQAGDVSIRPSDYVEELLPSQRLCPKCHSPLIERTATKGAHAGKKFMACSAYPRCRHIEAI